MLEPAVADCGERVVRVGFANPQFRSSSDVLGPSSRLGDAIFGYAEDMGDVDWLVVYGDVDDGFKTRVPRERRIILMSEPAEVLSYRPGFLDQFGTVLGPQTLRHKHDGKVVRTPPGVGWFYGVEFSETGARVRNTADELLALRPAPGKVPRLTTVLSRKTKTRMHRERLAFAERLKGELGDDFVIYGKGFQPIADKAEVIDGFRYHLALENCMVADCFTEKLFDPLIGWALPVYAGCPNVEDYLPAESFVRIDIDRPAQAIATIRDLLARDPWETHLLAIARARAKVIGELNIFALLRPHLGPASSEPLAKAERLRSNKHFKGFFTRFLGGPPTV